MEGPMPTSATGAIQPTETPEQPSLLHFSTDFLPPGEISEFLDDFGPNFLYHPTTPSDSPQTLVVIHGAPATDLSAGETAFY